MAADVLVVDDEADIRDLVAGIGRDAPRIVVTVASAAVDVGPTGPEVFRGGELEQPAVVG